MSQPSVLIIDDDVELCRMLEDFLGSEGLTVTSEHDGQSGQRRATEDPSLDAVVLDVTMPGANGFDVLRAIRRHHRVPVIMLTARGDDTDRIVGLELGADDYLPKPFNPRELAARLRAIWRRSGPRADEGEDATWQIGQLRISPNRRDASTPTGTPPLTGAEFSLLECLAEHPGQVRSKDELSEHALGRPAQPFDRSIDTHISRLRQKLEDVQAGVAIRNVRGKGYCMTVHEDL